MAYGQQYAGYESYPDRDADLMPVPDERRLRRIAGAHALQAAARQQYPELFAVPPVAITEMAPAPVAAEVDPVARPMFTQGMEGFDVQEAA